MQNLAEFYENLDALAQSDNTPQYEPSIDLENEGEAKTTYKPKSKKRCNDCETAEELAIGKKKKFVGIASANGNPVTEVSGFGLEDIGYAHVILVFGIIFLLNQAFGSKKEKGYVVPKANSDENKFSDGNCAPCEHFKTLRRLK